MPELPEVETIARGLAKRVTGDVIESVWLGSKPEPLKSPAAEIVRTLEGARIEGVGRMGKHIVFELARSGRSSQAAGRARRAKGKGGPDGFQRESREVQSSGNGQSSRGASTRAEALAQHDRSRGVSEGIKAQWIVHLGMTGQMLVCSADAEIEKHTHAIARLKSGRELRFVDPRRFGRLSVASNGEFETVGVEPLDVDLARFVSLFRGRKTPIKSALLNQKLLRGVGNIYADESLVRAGIRPRRRAAAITREQLQKLYVAVQEVLKEAIALGGSSISDYVDADGEEGFFQLQHRVYGREGEPCLVCGTPIKRVVIAGRSSHYCPKCQK